jgi:uncharacterized protein YcsI (UPF0317 family)
MTCTVEASTNGYRRHRRANESVCKACQVAARSYWRARPSKARYHYLRVANRNPGRTPRRILDVVETFQPVTVVELGALVDARVDTIRRAMYRLIADGDLVKTGAALSLPERMETR